MNCNQGTCLLETHVIRNVEIPVFSISAMKHAGFDFSVKLGFFMKHSGELLSIFPTVWSGKGQVFLRDLGYLKKEPCGYYCTTSIDIISCRSPRNWINAQIWPMTIAHCRPLFKQKAVAATEEIDSCDVVITDRELQVKKLLMYASPRTPTDQ